MYTLDKPKLDDSVEEIFDTCVAGYTGSPDKAAKLQSCRKLVKQDSDRYEKLIRAGNAFPKLVLPGGMKTAELYCVYDEKFARKGSPGRETYYEVIRDIPKNQKKPCPICGRKGKMTLDHFLPKSEYPTLCVTPENLLPICLECNTEKGTKSESNGYGLPVHLYFDRIPVTEVDGKMRETPYLHVCLGANFEAEYCVDCPAEWEEVLRGRLADQMKIYDLQRRFGEFAVIEMGNLETQWKQAVKGRRELLKQLHVADNIDNATLWRGVIKDTLEAELEIDPNSYKAALCRALYDKADAWIEWLENKESEENTSNT